MASETRSECCSRHVGPWPSIGSYAVARLSGSVKIEELESSLLACQRRAAMFLKPLSADPRWIAAALLPRIFSTLCRRGVPPSYILPRRPTLEPVHR